MRVNVYHLGEMAQKTRPLGQSTKRVDFPGFWLSRSGESGDVYYVGIDQISTASPITNFSVQSSADITIDYTLAEPATVYKSGLQDQVLWSATQTVSANALVPLDINFFTAIRITFNGAGIFTIYGR